MQFGFKLCLYKSPQSLHFSTNMKRSKPTEGSRAPKTQKVMESFLKQNDKEAGSSKSSAKEANASAEELMHEIAARRLEAGENVGEFNFIKKRARILTTGVTDVKDGCAGVLYWMLRDARVQDNWSFLFAQKLALKLKLPLIVACTHPQPFLSATLRHHKFYLDGLKEMAEECRALDIPFHLFLGKPEAHIPEFVRKENIGAVVCDFHSLREPRWCMEQVHEFLPGDVPLTAVDAHNLVPVWVASDKQEYGARTIRNKINTKLKEYLTEYPVLIKHPYADLNQLEKCKEIDWKAALESQDVDVKVDEVEWAKPGYKAACAQLHSFFTRRLCQYADKRNDPTANMISMMSPWFRYGHISVQRCILEVSRYKSKHQASVEAFCEEAIIRRELSDNFCYYTNHYDSVKGAANWAQETLKVHSKDKREFVYTRKEFEAARTHDDLWNSAQLQLEREGKMHGFLRMYWAKKILEWTKSPKQALEFAIYFNDKYALDGSDPNGFVGCMWSICGIHDQGWGERPVFGKIRFMNYQGCKRKFDVNAFVVRYGGKCYTKKTVT